MILQRYLERILEELLASENTCKNLTRTELYCKYRKILQVSLKNLAKKCLMYLTEVSWKKMNKSEISGKNLPRSCISCSFCKIFAIFFKNNALSCKILQETSKNLASYVWHIHQGCDIAILYSSFRDHLQDTIFRASGFRKANLSVSSIIYFEQTCAITPPSPSSSSITPLHWFNRPPTDLTTTTPLPHTDLNTPPPPLTDLTYLPLIWLPYIDLTPHWFNSPHWFIPLLNDLHPHWFSSPSNLAPCLPTDLAPPTHTIMGIKEIISK